MRTGGFISGLEAQSELTQLLDEIYGAGNELLDELRKSHGLPSLDKAEADRSTVLYVEVASVFA